MPIAARNLAAGLSSWVPRWAPRSPPLRRQAPSPSRRRLRTLVIGNRLIVLPSGCGTTSVLDVAYYRCGSVWVRP